MSNTVIKGRDNQSSFDVALNRYGTLEGLHVLFRDNPTMLSDTGLLVEGLADYRVGDAVAISEAVAPNEEVSTTHHGVDEYASGEGQSAFDVALTQYGAAGGIAQLLRDNPELVARDGELLGSSLTHKIDKEYKANNRLQPAMAKLKPTSGGNDTGGDAWIDDGGAAWINDDSLTITT